MKKIDYYAAPSSGMPKWMGYMLGGLFATIALGCVVVIVSLTRDNSPPPVEEKPVLAAKAEPVAAPATEAPSAGKVAVASNEKPAAAKLSKKASKAAKRLAAKHKRGGKVILLAKHSTSASDEKARSILAKRDTKQSRKAKDDLDKLLGL